MRDLNEAIAEFKKEIGEKWINREKTEIEMTAFYFAKKISIATGIDYEALIQFSDEHSMVQVTIKSSEETLCFVRAGCNE